MNLEELYQEIILTHFKHPKHMRNFVEGEVFEEAFNPTCGDKTRILGKVSGDRVSGLEHDTQGCAISIASASILCECLAGKSLEECRSEVRTFVDGLQGHAVPGYPEADPLAALLTVKRFPMRIRCATLSWEALERWLDRQDPVKVHGQP